MTKLRFSDHECPIAQALDEIGDWWTLLIVREALYGTRRFEDFLRALGIARNILSLRLKRLVDLGVMEKKRSEEDGRAFDYLLTKKGRALNVVVIALALWSNRWVAAPGRHRVEVRSRTTGANVKELRAIGDDDRPVDAKDIILAPGPGASKEFSALIAQIFRQPESE